MIRTASASHAEGCPREVEVVAMLLDRRSMRIDDEALAAHVDVCESCREVAELTRVMSADHERARREIRVPAAGQVWWRSAVRARLEAVHAAARPLTWSHGVAGACAIGLVIALIGLVWPAVQEATGWIGARALEVAPLGRAAATLMTTTLHGSVALMLVGAVFVLFAPVALYLALADE